jgi:hypothetical protein
MFRLGWAVIRDNQMQENKHAEKHKYIYALAKQCQQGTFKPLLQVIKHAFYTVIFPSMILPFYLILPDNRSAELKQAGEYIIYNYNS